MIKSFSGQVVFCFALRRAISAYVGENRLSQYTLSFYSLHKLYDLQADLTSGRVDPLPKFSAILISNDLIRHPHMPYRSSLEMSNKPGGNINHEN